MSTVGLISEYNPFHNGHLYHINKSKELTNSNECVVVMSGNFVQRGMPAIIDKFKRCEMALQNGADIVLEIPVMYATASSEYFASGSVSVLENSNIVDSLVFGSESGDLDEIRKVSKFLNSDNQQFENFIKTNMKAGLSYPLARNNALHSFGYYDIVDKPNNILAVDYLRYLERINSKIVPHTIMRKGSMYHDNNVTSPISSASGIRYETLYGKIDLVEKCIPSVSFQIYKEAVTDNIFEYNNLSNIFHYLFSSKPSQYLNDIFEMNEDLFNRINNSRQKFFLLSDIINDAKCKNYTQARINRAILNVLLDITKSDFEDFHSSKLPYIRVLGFRRTSSHVLSKLEANSKVPVITNLKNAKNILDTRALKILEKEISSTSLYNLCNNTYCYSNKTNFMDFENQLVIIY